MATATSKRHPVLEIRHIDGNTYHLSGTITIPYTTQISQDIFATACMSFIDGTSTIASIKISNASNSSIPDNLHNFPILFDALQPSQWVDRLSSHLSDAFDAPLPILSGIDSRLRRHRLGILRTRLMRASSPANTIMSERNDSLTKHEIALVAKIIESEVAISARSIGKYNLLLNQAIHGLEKIWKTAGVTELNEEIALWKEGLDEVFYQANKAGGMDINMEDSDVSLDTNTTPSSYATSCTSVGSSGCGKTRIAPVPPVPKFLVTPTEAREDTQMEDEDHPDAVDSTKEDSNPMTSAPNMAPPKLFDLKAQGIAINNIFDPSPIHTQAEPMDTDITWSVGSQNPRQQRPSQSSMTATSLLKEQASSAGQMHADQKFGVFPSSPANGLPTLGGLSQQDSRMNHSRNVFSGISVPAKCVPDENKSSATASQSAVLSSLSQPLARIDGAPPVSSVQMNDLLPSGTQTSLQASLQPLIPKMAHQIPDADRRVTIGMLHAKAVQANAEWHSKGTELLSDAEIKAWVAARESQVLEQCPITLSRYINKRDVSVGLVDKHWPVIVKGRAKLTTSLTELNQPNTLSPANTASSSNAPTSGLAAHLLRNGITPQDSSERTSAPRQPSSSSTASSKGKRNLDEAFSQQALSSLTQTVSKQNSSLPIPHHDMSSDAAPRAAKAMRQSRRSLNYDADADPEKMFGDLYSN